MPTLFVIFGFRFLFYSDDHEPIHVYVIKDGHEAKYNIEPLELICNHGFKKHEIALIESVIIENTEIIKERWQSFFKQR